MRNIDKVRTNIKKYFYLKDLTDGEIENMKNHGWRELDQISLKALLFNILSSNKRINCMVNGQQYNIFAFSSNIVYNDKGALGLINSTHITDTRFIDIFINIGDGKLLFASIGFNKEGTKITCLYPAELRKWFKKTGIIKGVKIDD